MPWTLEILPSALKDLGSFEKFDQVAIVKAIEQKLRRDPTKRSTNLKALSPNPVAQYQLRVVGRFRVLYNVSPERCTATVVLIGEKIGNKLFVQGKEFTRHHENRPSE